MTKSQSPKQYDLEERTLNFAKDVAKFVKLLPQSVCNRHFVSQLVRSSSSIGANYIEANECLGKKDFLMRLRTCRKEAKESIYWLRLLGISSHEVDDKRRLLIDEATQLMKIFGAIVRKTE
jgi:four helix bundle protein